MVMVVCLFFDQLGGPTWTVQLGRRDSTTASFSNANTDLASPLMNLDELISAFSNKGFNVEGIKELFVSQCWWMFRIAALMLLQSKSMLFIQFSKSPISLTAVLIA